MMISPDPLPTENLGPYGATKFAVRGFTEAAAKEWAQYGIHVNSISPGYIDTVLNEGDQLSGHRAVWADRNPMRRMGSPQELTGPVVLLCSDVGGSYLNGVDIVVDGMFFPFCYVDEEGAVVL